MTLVNVNQDVLWNRVWMTERRWASVVERVHNRLSFGGPIVILAAIGGSSKIFDNVSATQCSKRIGAVRTELGSSRVLITEAWIAMVDPVLADHTPLVRSVKLRHLGDTVGELIGDSLDGFVVESIDDFRQHHPTDLLHDDIADAVREGCFSFTKICKDLRDRDVGLGANELGS